MRTVQLPLRMGARSVHTADRMSRHLYLRKAKNAHCCRIHKQLHDGFVTSTLKAATAASQQ
jgi:hypothetical protein